MAKWTKRPKHAPRPLDLGLATEKQKGRRTKRTRTRRRRLRGPGRRHRRLRRGYGKIEDGDLLRLNLALLRGGPRIERGAKRQQQKRKNKERGSLHPLHPLRTAPRGNATTRRRKKTKRLEDDADC